MLASRALCGAFNGPVCRYSTLCALKRLPALRPRHPHTNLPRTSPALTARGRTSVDAYLMRNFGSFSANQEHNKEDVVEELPLEEDGTALQLAVTEDPVPWYLRVQNAEEYENTLLERQRLPDLPEDAPPQLNDIITHLSDGIGLEYLTLMDLRELDPPPALGTNLIMIIGTARSTRHLNVSADRFCRWLRSTYKLSPHADGLLGRNELKLKLRRRARRAKILGNKLRSSDGDDGLTTGWICVNAGALGHAAGGDQVVRSEDGRIIGFEQKHQGTHIVVQLLTEEKRKSLDLEGLWTKNLERQRRRLARLESDEEIEDLEDEDAFPLKDTPESKRIPEEVATNDNPPYFHEHATSHMGQRRGYHTLIRNRPALQAPSAQFTFLRRSHRDFTTRSRLCLPKDFSLLTKTNLREQLQQISTLPPREALAALGTGWEDRTSTPFLTSFYGEMGSLLTADHYRARLDLIQLAMGLQHPGYGVSGLLDTLKGACESLISVPQDLFHVVLDGMTQFRESDKLYEDRGYPGAEHILAILGVLEDMSLRGLNIFNHRTMENLFDAVLKMRREDPEAAAKYLDPHPLAQIALLADEHHCSLSGQSRCLAALEDLINGHKWDDMWRVWAWFPMREERRSSELYAAMFRLMAETKHQAVCMQALTRMVPTMELEDPPVNVEGDTAIAMLECLRVADPGIQQRYTRGETNRRPWGEIFEKCVEGLQASNASAAEPVV